MTACCEYSSWLLADTDRSEAGTGACGDPAVSRVSLTPKGNVSTIHLPVCGFHEDVVRRSDWVSARFDVGVRHRIVRR